MMTLSIPALLASLFALAGAITAAAIFLQRRTHIARWKLAQAERHALERRLHQSQKMESVGQLTSGIAHDFNNLLAIVTANVDLLEAVLPADPIVRERITSTRKATSRAANLTRRLLAFSLKESLNPAATNLEHSVRNALELAIHTLGRHIEIGTDFTPGMPPILVDPSALETALLNVFINARDAMPQGGTLHVATRLGILGDQPGTFAIITITDTGHGMEQATLDRVFEPFFTTKEQGKGTGLGLPMVYGFARQSKGHIQLSSTPGHGTTVTLYLPLADAAPAPRPQLVPSREATMGRQATILLVEDEQDLLDVAALYLQKLGYKILKAKTSAEALRLAHHCTRLDALITDINLPGPVNGIELAAKLSKQHKLQTIYTSGFATESLEASGLPADSVLRKPYRLTELSEMLLTSLDRNNTAFVSLAFPAPATNLFSNSALQ